MVSHDPEPEENRSVCRGLFRSLSRFVSDSFSSGRLRGCGCCGFLSCCVSLSAFFQGFTDLVHVERRFGGLCLEERPAFLDFDKIQTDAGEKKNDRADAGCFRQERGGLGTEQRLNISSAETCAGQALTAARLEKDHKDQNKTNDHMNNDQNNTHDATPAS